MLAAAVKGVGLVASLRVSDVDAQQVSDLFGTYDALELTHQSGQVGGNIDRTGTGSVREVQRYIAHPNEIKRLPDATAVVKLDRVASRGRTVTAIRFWPPEADWLMPAARWSDAPAAMAGPALDEAPYDDLPWLPDPPGWTLSERSRTSTPSSVDPPPEPETIEAACRNHPDGVRWDAERMRGINVAHASGARPLPVLCPFSPSAGLSSSSSKRAWRSMAFGSDGGSSPLPTSARANDGCQPGAPFTLATVPDDANALLDELFAPWRSQEPPPTRARTKALPAYAPADLADVRNTASADLGAELGRQLVSELLQAVRAGREGVFVSEPERLRTAIFLRGFTLGQFAQLAGMAPSTLSRALAGQPVAPSSWQTLITALVHAQQ